MSVCIERFDAIIGVSKRQLTLYLQQLRLKYVLYVISIVLSEVIYYDELAYIYMLPGTIYTIADITHITPMSSICCTRKYIIFAIYILKSGHKF